jgi:peptide/nickel transport system permease protein
LSVPPPSGIAAITIDYIWHMTLPVLSLTVMGFGGWALYVRNLMVRALGEDYVLMARARGLSEHEVVYGHAFRTILPPILTILLMSVPGLVSGAVITESVFSLHGVGTFLLEAVSGNDYPSAGAAFYLLALITVICNMLADIVYGIVDPRVRIEGRNE